MKTAYRAVVMVKDPMETAKLSGYLDYLADLPIDIEPIYSISVQK